MLQNQAHRNVRDAQQPPVSRTIPRRRRRASRRFGRASAVGFGGPCSGGRSRRASRRFGRASAVGFGGPCSGGLDLETCWGRSEGRRRTGLAVTAVGANEITRLADASQNRLGPMEKKRIIGGRKHELQQSQ